jgi:ADP-ribose pyrophosphatase YjhB (NUDIX family)
MRRSDAAVALIRREQNDQTSWLAQWNDNWSAFHVVSGHQRPGESFRACVVREVAEELGLREGVDFTVADQPPLHVEFTAWSAAARVETDYTMELFDVELTPAAQARVTEAANNRWLSAAEIAGERTHDGRPVSATMKRLLGAVRAKTERP